MCKEPDRLRLRKTDAFNEPDVLIDQQQEEDTIEQANIKDGDLLWLEQGKVCRVE